MGRDWSWEFSYEDLSPNFRADYGYTPRVDISTFVRAIFQYLNVERNSGLYISPALPETKIFFTQFLFSYKINPQTVLFLAGEKQRVLNRLPELSASPPDNLLCPPHAGSKAQKSYAGRQPFALPDHLYKMRKK